MKNLNIKFSYVKMLVPALILSFTLAACSKFENTPTAISGLSVIQASPTLEKFDLYVNNTKANQGDFDYTHKINYLNVYPGEIQVTLTKATVATPLLASKFTLETQTGYSLFVVNNLATVEYLFLKDDFTAPTSGKAKIRFVNASPNLVASKLSITGVTTPIFTNKKFKEYSTFESIDAADKVTFTLNNQETSALEFTLPDIKIEAGKIYTIYAKGTKGSPAVDGVPLELVIIAHN